MQRLGGAAKVVDRAIELLRGAQAELGRSAAERERARTGRVRARRGQAAETIRVARRVTRSMQRWEAERHALETELAKLREYEPFLEAFAPLFAVQTSWPNAAVYHLVLRSAKNDAVERLRRAIGDVAGEAFDLWTHPMPEGGVAVLLAVSARSAGRIERILAKAGVHELRPPDSCGDGALLGLLPRMHARRREIEERLARMTGAQQQLARRKLPSLELGRLAIVDRMRALEALAICGGTARAFVVEGWVPTSALARLQGEVEDKLGPRVSFEALSSADWGSDEPPVVLSNPQVIRPFERLVKLMPTPRYGSVDPTPFVAVFFPLLFGAMVGDVGYGALLGLLALVLRRRAQQRERSRGTDPSAMRDLTHVGYFCAISAVLFGLAYGELFGDLGHRWFGLRPLLLDREKATIPALVMSLGLGLVHVVLGLVLGVASEWRRHPRKAAGRGLSALMVLLIAASLLAAFEVLPAGVLTPAVVGLLAALPLLVALEGAIAPVELLATLGNVLSYARVMAIGAASLMLAVIANELMGVMGSALVGIAFALVFHLINFALALLSPTIHALRLHYVEFFGKFYNPGGRPYLPLSHPGGTAVAAGKETT